MIKLDLDKTFLVLSYIPSVILFNLLPCSLRMDFFLIAGFLGFVENGIHQTVVAGIVFNDPRWTPHKLLALHAFLYFCGYGFVYFLDTTTLYRLVFLAPFLYRGVRICMYCLDEIEAAKGWKEEKAE
jgi:hypothetical protein